MDPDKPSTPRRKIRYAPKPPPQRTPTAPPAQDNRSEAPEDSDEIRRLLRRIAESNQRHGQRLERRSSEHVTFFSPGASTSTSTANHGDETSGQDRKWALRPRQHSISSASNTGDSIMASEGLSGADDDSDSVNRENDGEPWDYSKCYPTSLPLRRPYSGDPEILDEAEFGDEAREKEYDENAVTAASHLGLLDESEGSEKKQLLLFQFPAALPLGKRLATNEGKEQGSTKSFDPIGKGKDGSSKTSQATSSDAVGRLEDFPAGHMGKMLVYKSGAVKLKLGETLFDVFPGTDCTFQQDVVAINKKDRQFCVLGQVEKLVDVAPDVLSILRQESE